jgi:SAM-dependent methyltransferase
MADAPGVGHSRYFLVEELPALLRRVASASPAAVLADLGCADGACIYALERAGLTGERVIAVDLNPERVRFCESLDPKVEGIVSDATNVTALADGSLDAVVASQLIEHLPDDRKLAPEIARLLRPGGWFYVSSVLRGRHAWWIYRANGRSSTDPTHLREYGSIDEFRAAVAHPELELRDLTTVPLSFPVLDMVVRVLVLVRLVRGEALPRLYTRHPRLAGWLRRLKVRVPGYRWIDVAGVRR